MYSQSVPALISKNVGNTLNSYKTWGGVTYNVKEYNAKGDGITDDSTAIQSAIDAAYANGGGVVLFPGAVAASTTPATYRVGTTIKLKSNVYLFAYYGSVILKATSSLPAGNALLANNTTTGSVDTYYDSDMTLEGIIFDGNNNSSRTAELVSFGKAKRVTIKNCTVQNVSYIGIAIGGCHIVSIIERCYFTATGNPVVTSEGGSAIWVATSGDGSISKNVTIDDCTFESLEWSGVYFMPNGGTISNCYFIQCKESGIFSNSNGSRISYINNYIYGTTRKNISASGIETGASHIRIIDNHIESCQNCGISLTDVQNAIISENELLNNGQDNVYYAEASGIGILSYSASPNQPDHILVRNNRIFDNQTTKTQVYGISISMTNANTPVTNITLHDNDVSGNKTKNIYYQSGVLGSSCYARGNLGDNSNSPKTGQVQAPAATGNMSVTGIGFKPRYIEFQAVDASTSRIAFSIAFASETASSGSRIDATNAASPLGGPIGKALSVIDSSGTVVCEATLSSMDQDGFTLNFTSVATRAWISYVAHP